jgi:hypothetical protein
MNEFNYGKITNYGRERKKISTTVAKSNVEMISGECQKFVW